MRVMIGVDVVGEQAEHGVDVVQGAVLEAAAGVVGLELRAGSGDAAVGHAHGAAGDVLLLEQGHAVAHLEQARGADEARGAGTDDDDVLGLGELGNDERGGGGSAEVDLGVAAGVGDGLAHGALDGHGGEGGTAHGVNLDALGGNDAAGQDLAGIGAHAGGLVVAQHAAVGDGAAGEGGLNIDIVLVAQPRGDVLAVLHASGGGSGLIGSGLALGGLGLLSECRHGGKHAGGGDAGGGLHEVAAVHFHGAPPCFSATLWCAVASQGMAPGGSRCITDNRLGLYFAW